MITRTKKQEIVDELLEKFRKASGVYLVDFTGITVEEAIELRRSFRKVGVDYQVAKNTLIKRALSEIEDINIPDEKFFGPSGVAFGYDDPVAPSKVIYDFFKEHEKPVLKVASIEGQIYDGSQLKDITKLPTREDMIAGIVGSLHAPTSGIVRSLSSPAEGIVGALGNVTRDLVNVIYEVAKKQNAA